MSALSFTPRFIAASDGTLLRTAVFEGGAQVCVLLHGQTEFIEKYGEVIGELRARGFTVATFDWRGQGGSVRLLDDPLKAHVGDFAEYDDDLASFLEQVVRPLSPAPPLALAHSMGGHILLRTLHDKPGAFRAAALSAPMLAVSARGYPGWLARAVTMLHAGSGRRMDFAWGMAARDPFLVDFAAQLCTTDAQRFARTQEILKLNPSLRLAGPTWGWLAAAYRSMARMAAPEFAEAIAAPVLMVAAGHDRIVVQSAERAFARRLPHATYVEIEDGEHELLMERDAVRARFWQAFDAFALTSIA
ncbi:MAG: alpha/beta hydrolase [Alphaproteobacteria bacterium]|nr:alpha/beta hydrolase [Alphaproteobacteria bacterium]